MIEQDDFISPYVKRLHGEISLEEFIQAEATNNADIPHTLFSIGSISLTENQWTNISHTIANAYVRATQFLKPESKEPTSLE